ncbi:MAG: hypothetical protein JWN31_53 [Frankiales bacterium]|nr:hypothetical protein [Frankiales bacterium]
MSRFKVPLAEVDKVHVPLDEQVEEQEPAPSPPPLSEGAERERANLRSAGGPV